MSEIIYLSKVRLSFPKLIEAQASQEGAAKKFGADLILTQTDPQFAKFMGEIGKVATEKWKEHAGAILQLIQTDRKLRCFGMGNEKIDKKTFKPYAGYQDNVYISANSNEDRPPQVIRPDGTIVPNDNTMERTAAARKLYGGCYVNAAVRPWPQDNNFGRGIRCELIAVQFSHDGEPFGESEPDVTGMFGAVEQPAQTQGMTGTFPSFFGTPQS